MLVLNRIACLQGVRNEIPNQVLAKDLAVTKNTAGIREIAENLFNRDKNIQNDCIKVLYAVGYINPELIISSKRSICSQDVPKYARLFRRYTIGI